jgi:hypothetical protein
MLKNRYLKQHNVYYVNLLKRYSEKDLLKVGFVETKMNNRNRKMAMNDSASYTRSYI